MIPAPTMTDVLEARRRISTYEGTRSLVEGAGAPPLAATLKIRDRLAGRKVALICTGGNISPDQLRSLYA